jgi:hypothetical protein
MNRSCFGLVERCCIGRQLFDRVTALRDGPYGYNLVLQVISSNGEINNIIIDGGWLPFVDAGGMNGFEHMLETVAALKLEALSYTSSIWASEARLR